MRFTLLYLSIYTIIYYLSLIILERRMASGSKYVWFALRVNQSSGKREGLLSRSENKILINPSLDINTIDNWKVYITDVEKNRYFIHFAEFIIIVRCKNLDMYNDVAIVFNNWHAGYLYVVFSLKWKWTFSIDHHTLSFTGDSDGSKVREW